LGAEILRLWVASTDYSGELTISDEILKRAIDGYRRIRNTLRFLLANTADFDIARDVVAPEDWLEIDRYALAVTRELQSAVLADFNVYSLHTAVQRLHGFCSEDLGAFYLDVLKDRLYTTGAASAPRRSAQSALWHITQTLLRLMAPILSFTAEEAWSIAGNGSESVQLSTWHVLPEIAGQDALMSRWSNIRSVRADVQRELEQLRAAGKIGSSLQAGVTVRVSGDKFDALASLEDDLRFVLITSQATLERASSEQDEGVDAAPSAAAKCERCWHYRDDVGSHAAHPGICGRCVDNLAGPGEVRRHA
jgi:isoleucyl-tRNA synthetase